MSVIVTETEFRVIDLETRMPFHFGNVAVTELPKVVLEIEVDVDGERQRGMSMGGLIPGWFYKDPELTLADGLENMVETFQSAVDTATRLDSEPTAFAFWRSLYERQRDWAAGTDHPPLLWGYGVSMVEQAVIDAVCRMREQSFATAVRENTLGIDLGSVYDELSQYEPGDLLPTEPQQSTAVRHTVGLDDPLTDDDLSPDERLNDGLPQTLAEYVRQDDISSFKIKLSANRERDAARLSRIGDVLADLGLSEYLCTVDANEGYDSARAFKRQWESHAEDTDLSGIFEHLAYVEQPLARDDAFTPETKEVFTNWDDAPPIIIDESDGRLENCGVALEYGYAGTSHKNCKGVFKGIVNACLVAHRDRTDPNDEYVISAEDLTTVGPIELQADLAVAATIGAPHVERNGHHYFRGLDAFPDSFQERTLEAHGDLYERHEEGFPTLDVEAGTVDLNSVVDSAFGVEPVYDVETLVPVEEWLTTLR